MPDATRVETQSTRLDPGDEDEDEDDDAHARLKCEGRNVLSDWRQRRVVHACSKFLADRECPLLWQFCFSNSC